MNDLLVKPFDKMPWGYTVWIIHSPGLGFGIPIRLFRASSSLKMVVVFSVGNVPHWLNIPSTHFRSS